MIHFTNPGQRILFIMLCALAISSSPPVMAEDNGLVVGRMKVTIMPEYDKPSVLVIQEGKFADRTAFPRKVKFILPKQVTKLTDACSLSPGGQHFCQLFDIEKGKERNLVNIKLPFSDFFIDYQYAPFTIKKNSQRKFDYFVHASYDIKTLEVHVQKPYRSEKFSVNPATADTYEKRGFEYHKYLFHDVKAGDTKKISISYFKADARPSVNIKFSVMKSPSVFEGKTGEILLGVGLIALGAIWFIRRKLAT